MSEEKKYAVADENGIRLPETESYASVEEANARLRLIETFKNKKMKYRVIVDND